MQALADAGPIVLGDFHVETWLRYGNKVAENMSKCFNTGLEKRSRMRRLKRDRMDIWSHFWYMGQIVWRKKEVLKTCGNLIEAYDADREKGIREYATAATAKSVAKGAVVLSFSFSLYFTTISASNAHLIIH